MNVSVAATPLSRREAFDGAVRELVARARVPPPAQLIVAADEEPLRVLAAVGLLALAPEVFAAEDERAVGPALERLPAVDEMDVLEARRVGRRGPVVPVGVGDAELDVVIVAEVPERAVLAVVRDVALARSGEEGLGASVDDLEVELGERVAGQLDDLRKRNPFARPTCRERAGCCRSAEARPPTAGCGGASC